jgi:hypothetical protein
VANALLEDRALVAAPPAAARVPLAAGVCIDKLLALLAWREKAGAVQLAGLMAAAAKAAGGQKQAAAAAQKVRRPRMRRQLGAVCGALRMAGLWQAAAAAAAAAEVAALHLVHRQAAEVRPGPVPPRPHPHLAALPAQVFDDNLDQAVALGWANVEKMCAETFHARVQQAQPALRPALALLAKLYAASRWAAVRRCR